MGALNIKPTLCPFERHLEDKRHKAKTMRYIKGKASDFYVLCGRGKLDEVRQILDAENALPIEELNKLQPNGSTPLHAASYYNHSEIVKLLLERNCARTTLNRFGNTAYEEAQTEEMRRLFRRDDLVDRFHETDLANTVALYLPETTNHDMNIDKTNDYVHIFKSEADILEYTINQQTTAMWVKFYNWFSHTFRSFIERDDLHVDAFDLPNHPDFNQFLKRSLSETNVTETMKSVREANQRNSIEPLISLYTSEDAGFYRPLNELLGQSSSSSNTKISPHLCDRFIIEFHIRRHELKHRAFTGITYRGATISTDDVAVYQQVLESDPPGVVGLKAFTSTSRDPLEALKFACRARSAEGKKHVLFIFEIAEVSPTIFGVDDVSLYSHEQEVLILPGNLFTVTKIQEQSHPAITKIYLKHWNTTITFWKKIKQTILAGRKSVLDSSEQN